MKKLLYILLLVYSIGFGQVPGFPGAEGGGQYTTGGRNGTVIHVTNLNASGSGSFRAALENTATRYIVFDVSGTIDFGDVIIEAQGNVTIAGQTAPYGGIQFTGGTIRFDNEDNIIIRHIRGRPAQATSGEVTHGDAFIFWGCENVILDHCSISFGGDQDTTFSCQGNDVVNITASKNLFGEGFTGVIFGYVGSGGGALENMSFIKNVLVDVNHRTPNVSGEVSTDRVDIINNVVYNWRNRLSHAQKEPRLNHVANWYKTGGMTEAEAEYVKYMKYTTSSPPSNIIWTRSNYFNDEGSIKLSGSSSENNQTIWSNSFTGTGAVSSSVFRSSAWSDFSTQTVWTAAQAYDSLVVQKTVGAYYYMDDNGDPQIYRDTFDDMRLDEVINDTGASNNRVYANWIPPTIPSNSRSGFDTDSDGMADVWETATFGDLSKTAIGNDLDANYDNIEMYFNQVDGTVSGSGEIPVVTITGANPYNITTDDDWIDPGATASDAEDGDITGSIVVGGDTVDDDTVGTYYVTYDVTDSDDNDAVQKTRTVNVSAPAPLGIVIRPGGNKIRGASGSMKVITN